MNEQKNGGGRQAPAPRNGNGQRPGARTPQRPRLASPRRAADDRTRIQAALGPDAQNGGRGPKKKGRVKPGIVVRTVFLNLLKAFVVVCCLGLMVGCVVGVYLVQYVVDTTENDDMYLDLDNVASLVNQTSYFWAKDPENPDKWIVHQELVGDENRIWVSYDQFPEYMTQAIVAVEDQTFWEHHGVNFGRTALALINEFIGYTRQFGASTIDQQLVKNLTGDDTVQSDGGDRTEGYKRKIREMFRAWSLNNNYDKTTILEAYLNTFGLSERLAGVEAGAQAYFGKTSCELTLAECATIAGVTNAPGKYSPFQNPEACRTRRNYVLAQMYNEGFISEAQKNEAQALPLGLAPRRQTATSSGSSQVFTYATDKVFKDVIADYMEQTGATYSTAFNKLYNGGWNVYMTVDLNVQQALDNIMVTGYEEGGYFMDETRFPGYTRWLTQQEEIKNSQGVVVDHKDVLPQAAVAVINYDGELVATNGYIGPKEASLSLNRAIGTVLYDKNGDAYVEGTVRQTGSTMKPIAAYALGMDYGIITYSKTIKDAPVQSSNPYNPQRNPETGEIIKDWPTNYGGGYRNATMPVVSAIAESTNTVPVQIGVHVGREQMFEFLTETLQVSSLVQPTDVDLSPLVLGGMTYGMCAYELAGAYMMFGGDETYGQYKTLHSYTRVTDAKGNVILEPEVTTVQAIDPQTGYIMNRLLSNVIRPGTYPAGGYAAYPTAPGMVPRHPDGEMDAVGKTGTTSDDRDRWFVGLTPYYVTTVWWGYDNQDKFNFRDRWSPNAATNIPVNVWKTLMEAVQAGLPIKEFPAVPEGVEIKAFCTTSGNLAVDGCPRMNGYYASFKIPELCTGHDDDEAEEPEE